MPLRDYLAMNCPKNLIPSSITLGDIKKFKGVNSNDNNFDWKSEYTMEYIIDIQYKYADLIMSQNELSSNDVERSLGVFREVNNMELEDLIKIIGMDFDKEYIDEWKFTGLNNVDFYRKHVQTLRTISANN